MCREIKPRPEALPNVCGGFKSLLLFINVFIKTNMFSAYRCMPGTVLRAGVRWSALDMEPLSWWSVGERVRGKPLVSFSQKAYLQMLVSAKVYDGEIYLIRKFRLYWTHADVEGLDEHVMKRE